MKRTKTYNIYLIYRATCVITGKSYIGKTKNGSRRKAHLRSAFKLLSYFTFHKALRQYPEEWMWEWDLVGLTTDIDCLSSLEKQAITRFNTHLNGYNMECR